MEFVAIENDVYVLKRKSANIYIVELNQPLNKIDFKQINWSKWNYTHLALKSITPVNYDKRLNHYRYLYLIAKKIDFSSNKPFLFFEIHKLSTVYRLDKNKNGWIGLYEMVGYDAQQNIMLKIYKTK